LLKNTAILKYDIHILRFVLEDFGNKSLELSVAINLAVL